MKGKEPDVTELPVTVAVALVELVFDKKPLIDAEPEVRGLLEELAECEGEELGAVEMLFRAESVRLALVPLASGLRESSTLGEAELDLLNMAEREGEPLIEKLLVVEGVTLLVDDKVTPDNVADADTLRVCHMEGVSFVCGVFDEEQEVVVVTVPLIVGATLPVCLMLPLPRGLAESTPLKLNETLPETDVESEPVAEFVTLEQPVAEGLPLEVPLQVGMLVGLAVIVTVPVGLPVYVPALCEGMVREADDV